LAGVKFLFIYNQNLEVLGGGETLIARMAKWLLDNGHTATLLVPAAGGQKKLMPPGLRIVSAGSAFLNMAFYFNSLRVFKSLGIETPDVIKTFDEQSAWLAFLLGASLTPRPRVLVGVYGSTFFPSQNLVFRNVGRRILIQAFMRCVDADCRLFAEPGSLQRFGALYGPSATGVIWPIPVDGAKFDSIKRNPKWGKIVSIGRLSPMKEYNLYMPGAVKELISQGYDVEWWVYGDGPYREQMLSAIQKHSLAGRVRLEGPLAYEDIAKVLSDAYIFVGMGTSVVEAAFCKVPAIVALAHDGTGLTYGPIHAHPEGSMGDYMEQPPSSSIKEEIRRVLDMPIQDYVTEACLGYSHVRCFDLDAQMHRFVELARQAQPVKRASLIFIGYYIYFWIRKVLDTTFSVRRS
jgi:glycosyltransferase involved in cell wall biosynthesis